MNLVSELVPSQFSRLANIMDNAGQVVLATAVLSPLLTGLNKVNWLTVIAGVFATLSLWAVSLFLEREAYYEY